MKLLKKIVLIAMLFILAIFIILIFQNMKNKVSVGEPTESGVSADFARAYLSGPKQTEMAAEKLATLIFENNPDGPLIIDGEAGIQTLNPSRVVEQVLSGQIKDATEKILFFEVDEEKIKILSASDREATVNYLTRRSEIMHDGGALILERDIDFSNPKIIDFEMLTLIYANTINAIYALGVPENLVFVHKEQIRLLEIYKNIFASLAGHEEDPLRASVAISLLTKVEEDLSSLEQAFSNIIDEVNLTNL